MKESSITDWISAIAASVGVLAAIITVIKLLIKDRERQKEISALMSLTKTQGESLLELKRIVTELSKHSLAFDEQTDIMKRSSLQKAKERRLSIVPRFQPSFSANTGMGGTLELKLHNNGGMANVFKVATLYGNIKFDKTYYEPSVIEGNRFLTLIGECNEGIHPENVGYDVEVFYSDVDGNNYKAIVKGIGHTFNVTEPKLLNQY